MPMAEVLLSARDLSRRFGGLMAVSGVAIELSRSCLHAVVGPNGAGKSTLINLLSGDLRPSSGSIAYMNHDITMLSPDRRSRLGIGRSYQKTNVFPLFTAFEKCRLAAQSRAPKPWNWWKPAEAYQPACETARHALEAARLAHRADCIAETLSHGEQRQLELAMVLATAPQVLLLDEPLAGMGNDEAACMVELLQCLKPDHAILLIEHDMDAVFAVADVITVMVNGQVLESGPPAVIRASAPVRQAYLGNDEAVSTSSRDGAEP